MKKIGLILLGILALNYLTWAQSATVKSTEFTVNLANGKPLNGDIPQIEWAMPIPDINFSYDGRFGVKVRITGSTPINAVTIEIKDQKDGTVKAKQTIVPVAGEEFDYTLEKNLFLPEGNLDFVISAQNTSEIVVKSVKKVYVGEKAIAGVSKLDRTDYALIFATDDYQYWSDLVNPVFDSRTISGILEKDYGFKVEILENATQSQILSKIREYSNKQFKPMDQLFIFFAGHGTYDQTFGEGFVVTTESLPNDEAKTSYLSHNRLRSIINNIPSEHIFLSMDVCFGGTFDEQLASARGMEEEVYMEKAQSEFVTRKLMSKTRQYLTSGGKTYVSDGIPGQHSPFAKKFIEALESKGGQDGILTLAELWIYVEKLKIEPKMGSFGDNGMNSDFLFIVK